MSDAPRTIWVAPWMFDTPHQNPVRRKNHDTDGDCRYHHDDVVRELREALAGLERLNYSTMTDDEMRREADLGNEDAPFILRARAALAKLAD